MFSNLRSNKKFLVVIPSFSFLKPTYLNTYYEGNAAPLNFVPLNIILLEAPPPFRGGRVA